MDAEARSVLLAELRDGQRKLALVAFEALRDPTFTADLLALLDDPATTSAARRATLKALASLRATDPTEVVRALVARLTNDASRDADAWAAVARCGGAEAVRAVLAQARAGHWGHPGPIPPLALARLPADPGATAAILDALVNESEPDVLLVVFHMVASPAGVPFVPALIDLDRGTREDAIRGPLLEALGCIGGVPAARHLLERARGSGRDAAIALRALGSIHSGGEATAACLELALAQPTIPPRSASLERSLLRALGGVGCPTSVPCVARRLADTDVEIRREAIRALGRLGAGARVEVRRLCDLFVREDGSLRGTVLTALGAIGGPEALEALRALSRLDGLTPALRETLRRSEVAAGGGSGHGSTAH